MGELGSNLPRLQYPYRPEPPVMLSSRHFRGSASTSRSAFTGLSRTDATVGEVLGSVAIQFIQRVYNDD